MFGDSVENIKVLITCVGERDIFLGFGLSRGGVHLCHDLQRHWYWRPTVAIDAASFGQAYAIIISTIAVWSYGNGSDGA